MYHKLPQHCDSKLAKLWKIVLAGWNGLPAEEVGVGNLGFAYCSGYRDLSCVSSCWSLWSLLLWSAEDSSYKSYKHNFRKAPITSSK